MKLQYTAIDKNGNITQYMRTFADETSKSTVEDILYNQKRLLNAIAGSKTDGFLSFTDDDLGEVMLRVNDHSGFAFKIID